MPTLYERIYGCLAGSRIGSAMGAAVEGWDPERIQETHGRVTGFLPYTHYRERGITWERMPGTTEDGIERQKLMCAAIIAKQGRITAEDLHRTASELTDLDNMRYMTQPEDLRVIGLIKAGVPAAEVGRLSGWHGLNFARACQPIGCTNAGQPDEAVRDVRDIGRLFFPPTDSALDWAAVYVAGIAAALAPDATVVSTIAAAREAAPERYRWEIDRALEIATVSESEAALRAAFYRHYDGWGIPYAISYGNETVCKALAVFRFADGNAREAILVSVNMGRDTDCLAASAGGLAGALTGLETLPQAWIDQVDRATAANPYANIQGPIEDHAKGLYQALQSRAHRARAWANRIVERDA